MMVVIITGNDNIEKERKFKFCEVKKIVCFMAKKCLKM